MAVDVTQVALPEDEFDLWHDRAVFHFLTEPNDRELYLASLRRSLKSGGHLVLATFADDGPKKCSGLNVERYDIDKMTCTVGGDFELLQSFREQHHTPFDTMQSFLYAHFRLSK